MAATRFVELVASGGLAAPPPGGETTRRWRVLAELAAEDLVARLAEAQLDALAIMAELCGEPAAQRGHEPAAQECRPRRNRRWAVWAARRAHLVPADLGA